MSKKRKRSVSNMPSSADSVCPICLLHLPEQCALLSCGHKYCRPCLLEWFSVSSTCPLDRSQVESFLYGEKVELVERKDVDDNEDDLVLEEPQEAEILCENCRMSHDEHVLLLCDHCDKGACHTYCCDPPLDEIPEGEWVCKSCTVQMAHVQAQRTSLRRRLLRRRRRQRRREQQLRQQDELDIMQRSRYPARISGPRNRRSQGLNPTGRTLNRQNHRAGGTFVGRTTITARTGWNSRRNMTRGANILENETYGRKKRKENHNSDGQIPLPPPPPPPLPRISHHVQQALSAGGRIRRIIVPKVIQNNDPDVFETIMSGMETGSSRPEKVEITKQPIAPTQPSPNNIYHKSNPPPPPSLPKVSHHVQQVLNTRERSQNVVPQRAIYNPTTNVSGDIISAKETSSPGSAEKSQNTTQTSSSTQDFPSTLSDVLTSQMATVDNSLRSKKNGKESVTAGAVDAVNKIAKEEVVRIMKSVFSSLKPLHLSRNQFKVALRAACHELRRNPNAREIEKDRLKAMAQKHINKVKEEPTKN